MKTSSVPEEDRKKVALEQICLSPFNTQNQAWAVQEVVIKLFKVPLEKIKANQHKTDGELGLSDGTGVEGKMVRKRVIRNKDR